jgi:mono/diheme cytochrome c family protein
LAHTAVARLLEKQDRLVEALAAYVRFASSCPRSDAGTMGLVRVLRKLAHIEEARAVAESLDSSSDLFSEFRVEMGAIELELGNYQEAIRWFGQAAAAHGDKKQELLRNAATAFALEEEAEVANRLFERADAEEAAELRISELLTQLAVVPGRQEAADELQRLSAAAAEAAPQPAGIEQERSRVGGRENNKLAAAELFALHCAACHGADGSGDGRAARHQFPRPRDLRTEDFRLVSTDNGNPTVEDLKKVIKHGMPGTSMRAFDHLSEQQLQLLAEEVVRIRREGVRDWYVALLQADDEQIDEEDVQEVVDLRSLPGGVVRVPAIGPADPAAVARGKDVYIRSGCRPCHGDDGAGAGEVVVFDQQGLPEWPRDLVSGPFKGGHEPESIYLRILAGMPGSAHPATKTLTDQQYIDLVHYCRSLSRQPKQALTNHQRFLEATQRPLPSMVPETTADTGATTGGPP